MTVSIFPHATIHGNIVLQRGVAYTVAYRHFDLDIFTRMKGKSIDDFRPRFRYIESGGVRIPFIAPDDLLFLKQGSWREKDQIDVAAIKEIIERERKAKE